MQLPCGQNKVTGGKRFFIRHPLLNKPMNTLYYGDNLNILRRYIAASSFDLVYLDPPFNSNRNYNVLFKDESGLEADSLEWLSADTWHWKGAASTYDDLIMTGDKVSEMLQAFRSFIGENQQANGEDQG